MLEQERHGTAGQHYETCQTSSFDFPLKQKKTKKSPGSIYPLVCHRPSGRRALMALDAVIGLFTVMTGK